MKQLASLKAVNVLPFQKPGMHMEYPTAFMRRCNFYAGWCACESQVREARWTGQGCGRRWVLLKSNKRNSASLRLRLVVEELLCPLYSCSPRLTLAFAYAPKERIYLFEWRNLCEFLKFNCERFSRPDVKIKHSQMQLWFRRGPNWGRL